MLKKIIKPSEEAKALGIKINLSPFNDGKKDLAYTVSHNGSGIGRVYTQEQAEQWCDAYCRGYWEGNRSAFVEILEVTNTKLGGFY